MKNTTRLPGLVLQDHFFDLPLNYSQPKGESISVYAREVGPAEDENGKKRPYLLFFQGGPGFGAMRPMANTGWIKCALERGYRVLLLDQRGTGRSSVQNHQSLARFKTAASQAQHLKFFRADSIVRDAEAIRCQLLGEQGRWSLLGQSFGGFCITHYLSAHATFIDAAYITGGLPPLTGSADDVYRKTYRRCLEKNKIYYRRYPGDVAKVREIATFLENNEVRMPDGATLTTRRFQQLGLAFGMSDGYESVHYLIEDAFISGPKGPELSYSFLCGIQSAQDFETNPLFAILHEAIYTQGSASCWSAHRMRGEFPEFDAQKALADDRELLFTGEMIYPWMFKEYKALRPLAEAAEILAQDRDWPLLYNPKSLAKNTVPCAAALYYEDMYVDRDFSRKTAESIQGLKLWITNEFDHNGLRVEADRVLGRLIDMVRGDV